MYDSGRLIIHDLDKTCKSCLCWRSVENGVCKPKYLDLYSQGTLNF